MFLENARIALDDTIVYSTRTLCARPRRMIEACAYAPYAALGRACPDEGRLTESAWRARHPVLPALRLRLHGHRRARREAHRDQLVARRGGAPAARPRPLARRGRHRPALPARPSSPILPSSDLPSGPAFSYAFSKASYSSRSVPAVSAVIFGMTRDTLNLRSRSSP